MCLLFLTVSIISLNRISCLLFVIETRYFLRNRTRSLYTVLINFGPNVFMVNLRNKIYSELPRTLEMNWNFCAGVEKLVLISWESGLYVQ
jgi:hypothetical protein